MRFLNLLGFVFSLIAFAIDVHLNHSIGSLIFDVVLATANLALYLRINGTETEEG